MKQVVWLIGLSVLLFGCGSEEESSQDEKSLVRIGTDATYPPFESINPATDQPAGFDIDLMTEICRFNGWQPEFVPTAFDHMIAGLTNEEYDVVISAMTITPQRSALVNFSDPYYVAGQSIAVPIDDSIISNADDLMGKKVGVQLGTTGEVMAKKMEGLHVYSFDNIGAAFDDLSNGNLDAVLNDYPTTRDYTKKHGTAKIVGNILSTEYYGIAVRKEDQKRLESINRALKSIMNSDRFRDIHYKWFGTYPTSEIPSNINVSE
jgi:ABC-type amino acid transport substrate-binding protein